MFSRKSIKNIIKYYVAFKKNKRDRSTSKIFSKSVLKLPPSLVKNFIHEYLLTPNEDTSGLISPLQIEFGCL